MASTSRPRGEEERSYPSPQHSRSSTSHRMNDSVSLARVSLRDSLLAVCDQKGLIVFATEDCYTLGMGPTKLIGSCLVDLLTEDDRHEFKASMRRKSGTLLRCLSGCFIWLDIQCVSPVPPRLRRALQTAERIRACSSSAYSSTARDYATHPSSSSSPWSRGHVRRSLSPTISCNNNYPGSDISLSKGGGSGANNTIEDHILTKERTLEWFTTTEEECMDRKGGGAAAAAATSALTSSTHLSLESLSLHSSQSSELGSEEGDIIITPPPPPYYSHARNYQLYQPSPPQFPPCAATGSSSNTAGGQEMGGKEGGMGTREYSFREIFEYLGRHSASFCRQPSVSSLALEPSCSSSSTYQNQGGATLAASMVEPRAMTLGEKIAAKCRAPEQQDPLSTSSWLEGGGGFNLMGRAATTTVGSDGGHHVSLGLRMTCAPNAEGVSEESGWDWYLDL